MGGLKAAWLVWAVLAGQAGAQAPDWYRTGEIIDFIVPAGAQEVAIRDLSGAIQWQWAVPDPDVPGHSGGLVLTMISRAYADFADETDLDHLLAGIEAQCPGLVVEERFALNWTGASGDTAVLYCPDAHGDGSAASLEMMSVLLGRERGFVLHGIWLDGASDAALQAHLEMLDGVVVCDVAVAGTGC